MQSSVLRARGFQLAFDEMKFAGGKSSQIRREERSVSGSEGSAGNQEARNVPDVRCGVNGRSSRGKPSWCMRVIDISPRVAASSPKLPSRPENRGAIFIGEKAEPTENHRDGLRLRTN